MTREEYLEKLLEVAEVWEQTPEIVREWTLIRLHEMEQEIETERMRA